MNHFYFIPTNTIAELDDEGLPTYYEIKHAKTYMTKYDFQHSAKLKDKTSFIDLWLNDDKRRSIREIDEKPSKNPEVYSPPFHCQYVDFKFDDESKSNAVTLFNELLNVLSNHKKPIKDYMLNWLSHIIQKPFENPKTAIILTGSKGCGKDTLGDFMCEWVLGNRNCQNYTSTEQFWDKHDKGRENKKFIKVEEASGTTNKQHIGEMKARITSFTNTVNPKGLKPRTSSNYNRYFMTSNDPKPVKVEDNERRFNVIACSSDWVGKYEKWDEVRRVLFCGEGAYLVGAYLETVDISMFDPRKLPENEYLEQAIQSEKTPEDLFIEVWDGEECSGTVLYDKYRSYCIEKNLFYAKSAVSLGHKLMIYLRDGKIQKKRSNSGIVYSKLV